MFTFRIQLRDPEFFFSKLWLFSIIHQLKPKQSQLMYRSDGLKWLFEVADSSGTT